MIEESEHHEQCRIEEPWTNDRVACLYREITLKSDTEPAIIVFSNRVAEMCKAEVTTEDAVKGDKEWNGAHRERSDADMWNHHNKNSENTRQWRLDTEASTV